MAVFVTMTVRPPDPARFEAACKDFLSRPKVAGEGSRFWGHAEGDEEMYIIAGVWESHDAMHANSEKVGDEFNREAGTEGVDWETRVYTISG